MNVLGRFDVAQLHDHLKLGLAHHASVRDVNRKKQLPYLLIPVILQVQIGVYDELGEPVEVDSLPDPFEVFLSPEIIARDAHLHSVNLHARDITQSHLPGVACD